MSSQTEGVQVNFKVVGLEKKNKPVLIIDPHSVDVVNEGVEVDGVVIIPGKVRTQSRVLPRLVGDKRWSGPLDDNYTHIARMTTIKDLTYNRIEALKKGDDNQVRLLTFKINALIGSLTTKSQYNESIKSSMVDVSNIDRFSIIDEIIL